MPSLPWVELEQNGVDKGLADLAKHDGCLTWLTRMSAMSTAIVASRESLGLDLLKSGSCAVDALGRTAESLELSGIGGLLRSLPVDGFMLSRLTLLTILASCLGTIRRCLDVDLLKPGALDRLKTRVTSFNASYGKTISLPRIPA